MDVASSNVGSLALNIESSNDTKPKKRPRKILHFSDGTLEEYSTDEEAEKPEPKQESQALIDVKTLTWKPWLWYWMTYSSSSALTFCDYVGESLANFLGITSPKYQYEIEEYHRMVAEEEEEKKKEDLEMAGWTKNEEKKVPSDSQIITTVSSSESQPGAVLQTSNEVQDNFTDLTAAENPQITVTTPDEVERY